MAKSKGSGRSSGVGPMGFGRSTIGWGASASPAAYAMGRAYGSLPVSRAAGTSRTPGNARRILNPWGNNVPKSNKLNMGIRGGRRMPTAAPDLIRIDYPANDPRCWPIAGGKIVIFNQAEKANRHNAILNHAYVRAGYAQYNSPTVSGTDTHFANEGIIANPPGT